MNVQGHFEVERIGQSRFGSIRVLRCRHCGWGIALEDCRQFGDRSGLGPYNRAKGKMVSHLHAEHREQLT